MRYVVEDNGSDGSAVEQVEDCVSFLFGKASQQISKLARGKLQPYGVTPVQYAVLKVLWQGDGLTAAEIGARLVIDSATITGIIDRLEGMGLLRRRDDATDRRLNRLALTAKGRALEGPLDAEMDDLNREVWALVGRGAPALRTALRKIGGATKGRERDDV